MFDSNDVKWFNQQLFSYSDTKLNSNGTIKLTLTTSSKEGLNFNSPGILLTISNQLSKSVLLRIEHLYDIVESFDIIYKMFVNNDPNIFGVEFERRYSKNTSVILKTMKREDSGEIIIRFMLQSGLNDLTYVDFKFRIFQAIYKLISNFTDSYLNICFSLLSKQIDTFNLDFIRDTPITLKSILSNLNTIKYSELTESSAQLKIPEITEQTITNKEKTDKDLSELNEFLGRDMNNIKVPGITEIGTKEYKPDVKSKFILNVLDKNLYNFQKFLVSIKDNPDSLNLIIQFIKSGYSDDFDVLPGIKDDEYKSAVYVSEVIWKSIILLHERNKTQIPYGTHVIFYNPENIPPENVDLAFDLLMLMSYIKVLRTKLEDRTPDYVENCSMFYTQFRYLMAILCFSFIRNQDPTQVSNIILNRFKDYNKIGFFDYYNTKLENFNCKPITSSDIMKVHNDFFEKFLEITKNVIDLHADLYKDKNLIIPPNSEFNREQIINEIIPLQILKHIGDDLSTYKDKFSETIFSLFSVDSKEKPKEEEKKKEEKSNIIRYIESNKDKVPENEYRFLMKSLRKLKSKNFKFEEHEISYIEFEDEIIKALHVWKPEDDSKLMSNYGYFLKCCEDCILDKQQILSLASAKIENSTWSEIDMFLGK